MTTIFPQPQETRAAARVREQQAELIILCQALGSERTLAALTRAQARKIVEPLSSEAAPHPSGRDRCAQRIAHHQRLAMRLREFIRIVARNPRRAWLRFRQHGKLDEVGLAQPRVQRQNCLGMHHVLGIMVNEWQL